MTKTFRSNGMPLVHHSRRLRQNFLDGNPFSSKEGLAAHLAKMEARYMDPQTKEKVCRALHVEMDMLAEVIDAQMDGAL